MKHWTVTGLALLALNACTPLSHHYTNWKPYVDIDGEGHLYAYAQYDEPDDAKSKATRIASAACSANSGAVKIINTKIEYTGKLDEEKLEQEMDDYKVAIEDYKEAMEQRDQEVAEFKEANKTMNYYEKQALIDEMLKPAAPDSPLSTNKDYKAIVYFKCVDSE